MSNLIKSGQCKHTTAQTASDTVGGAIHGLFSLFGFGSIGPNPLGDAQSSVSNALKNINKVTAQQSLAAAAAGQTEMNAMYKSIQTHTELENIIIQDQTNQIWEAIQEENLFLLYLGILIVVTVFFFLIRKKCC